MALEVEAEICSKMRFVPKIRKKRDICVHVLNIIDFVVTVSRFAAKLGCTKSTSCDVIDKICSQTYKRL